MTSCKSTIIFTTDFIGTDYIISGYRLSTVPTVYLRGIKNFTRKFCIGNGSVLNLKEYRFLIYN